jgi:hypothetical protein
MGASELEWFARVTANIILLSRILMSSLEHSSVERLIVFVSHLVARGTKPGEISVF